MKVAFMASDKPREQDLGAAFIEGVRRGGDKGEVTAKGADTDADVIAMVGVKSREMFRDNIAAGRHVVMLDKGYTRHRIPGAKVWEYWRVAVDAHHPTRHVMDRRDTRRAKAMNIRIAPWRTRGERIVIAGSSAKYHDFYGLPDPTEYATQIVARLREFTDWPIVYRPKPSWKAAAPIDGTIWSGDGESIGAALTNAWALVTHGSNACFEAITSGVPCIILGDGVALPISSTRLDDIEAPFLASDVIRRRWLCGLSYCQWTQEEFASGSAWAEIKRRIE